MLFSLYAHLLQFCLAQYQTAPNKEFSSSTLCHSVHSQMMHGKNISHGTDNHIADTSPILLFSIVR